MNGGAGGKGTHVIYNEHGATPDGGEKLGSKPGTTPGEETEAEGANCRGSGAGHQQLLKSTPWSATVDGGTDQAGDARRLWHHLGAVGAEEWDFLQDTAF